MIEVKKLCKEFTKNVKKNEKISFLADDNLSFTAKPGEVLGILGPNGAGKTTLLRMIAGIMEPTSGEVLVNGLNYKENAIEIKRQIAFLSGNTKLYKDISPYELLKMCGEYYNIESKELVTRATDVDNIINYYPSNIYNI